MFDILRKAITVLDVARATDAFEDPSTRQRTRTRTTSLKGEATCRRQALLVEVTVATSPHALTAVALIQHKHPRLHPARPVFVSTHTATEDHPDVLRASSNIDLSATENTSLTYKSDASERVDEPDESADAGEAAVPRQVWRDENDAHEEIPQNLGAAQNPPISMKQSTESTNDLLATLYYEPGAIVWESAVPDVPSIVLTPADESWNDFTGRCSNQPNQQWDGALHVPLSTPDFSPFGPIEPQTAFAAPVPVFSPAQFAVSVSRSARDATYQSLFAQRHTYKAVAYVACLAGASLRTYYDNPSVLLKLDKLCVFTWTDPAAPFLAIWRTCFMVSVYESENPFGGVPHIVVTGSLPNAPWDTEPALVPEQDERLLMVPTWRYTEVVEEEEEDDKWYCGDDEEEEVPSSSCVPLWSESEEESDDVRTPSPPPWSLRAFPSSIGRQSSTLHDVFEEDEDDGTVPSVLETRFRRSWLQDEDDVPVPPPVTRSLSSRFNFRTTLPEIGERTPEDAYRPLAVDYKPLWTSTAMLAISTGDEADDSAGPDGDDSGDDQSQYTDALDQQQESEAESHYVDAAEQPVETDVEDDYRSNPHRIPRPSCDIFLNDEDGEPPHQQPPRGKANIPAGKSDWFDLLDDSDLGSLDWPAPRTNTNT